MDTCSLLSIGETQYEDLAKSPWPWNYPYCITQSPFPSVNNKDLHSLALPSGPTKINNHASPAVQKNQQKSKRIPEKVPRNVCNI